jgi:hypothetical protein
MKRALQLLSVVILGAALALVATAQRGGPQGGKGGSKGPGMQGQQQQGQPQQQRQRQQDQARTQEHQRSKLHDCQQACVKAMDESKQLQRYADKERFEADTAMRLGNQLREHLQVMDREHARLRERLTAEERERFQARLENMDGCQARWQQAYGEIVQELMKDKPNQGRLRSQARAVEKQVKSYRKELDAIEKEVQ